MKRNVSLVSVWLASNLCAACSGGAQHVTPSTGFLSGTDVGNPAVQNEPYAQPNATCVARTFSVPTALTSDLKVAIGGNLYFPYAASTGPAFGIVNDATGAFRSIKVPAGGSQVFLAYSSDGNLWFTDPNSASIGRLTPTGAIHEFPVAGGNGAFFLAAATAADGTPWISSISSATTNDNVMIHVHLNGTMSFYPDKHNSPIHLAIGPDNELWETNGTNVDEQSSTGVYRFVATLPTFFDYAALATGADHAVWVAAIHNDHMNPPTGARLYRVPTFGKLTSFPIVPTGFTAGAIAEGADGNLWAAGNDFRTFSNGQGILMRFTTTGAMRAFYLPHDATMGLLAADRSRNIWYMWQNGARSEISELPLASTACHGF